MHRIALKCGRFYRSIPRCVNASLNNYNKSIPRLQYATTSSPSIDTSLSDNNGADNGTPIDRTTTRPQRTGIQEATDATNSIKNVKFFAEENIIQIAFSDGRTANFNAYWLRDSCVCPQCVHSITRTKLMSSADICDHLTAQHIECFETYVEIQWRDESFGDHTSRYTHNWLQMFADVFRDLPQRQSQCPRSTYPNDGLYAPVVPLPERLLWKSAQINRQELTTKYTDFMTCDKSLRNFLRTFLRFGIAFLDAVPTDRTAVLSVARRIAYERPTSYGSTFDVRSKADTTRHIAYTGAPLEPHVDLPYRERSPGVQILHCLEPAQVGGASTLVDGVKCAEVLREANRQLFDVLTKNPVLFAFCDKTKGIWFREKWPIVGLNADDSVKEVHYSRIAMRPPLLPVRVLDNFYEAYRRLTDLVRDDNYVFRYQLRAGDLIVINNRRVLHGREGYDHQTQNRHLMGCYVDLDELEALYEKINE